MKGALFTACLAIAVPACSRDFEPYNRLTSLRVLAMKSEPAAPAFGEIAVLTPLVFTPAPDPSLTFAWSWCPFPGTADAGYPCLATEEQLAAAAAQVGQQPPPPFDLGNAPTAMLPFAVPPPFLAQACATLRNCRGGFPIQVKLVVRTDTDEVIAVFAVRFRLDPASGPNANPSFQPGALTATIGGLPQPVVDPPEITLPRDVSTPIAAAIDPAHAERYTDTDALGNVVPDMADERLILSWFVETGTTDERRTSLVQGMSTVEDAQKNTWKPDPVKDYPSDTARLYVVISDSRGGVGWQGGTVRLENQP